MNQQASHSPARAILRVVSGNFLEMYDFMVFGFYAADIGNTFFPSGNKTISLMASLMAFGAGYLMRPLGAIFLGAYIDRKGRRVGLLLTLGLMAMGTLLIACVPGYASIGLAAPLLVLFGRLLQGLSAGVELGGVSVYLSEIATPGNKGFYVSWQSASQQVAVVLAGLLGVILHSTLSKADISAWGWRVPFFIGCMIVPFLFFIRRSLEETPEFSRRKHHPSLSEILRSIGSNFGLVLGGMFLVVMTTVSFYTITAYTPTFGKEVLKLSDMDSFIVTVCVGVSNFFWLPVMGALSDRIGRRPLLLTFTGLMLVSAYPVMYWLTHAPSFANLLIAELWLSFLYASYNGAMVVTLTEVMPATVRTTGFSLAYSLATALGGNTPAIATGLIQSTHNKAMPGAMLSIAAVLALGATLLLTQNRRESTDIVAAKSPS